MPKAKILCRFRRHCCMPEEQLSILQGIHCQHVSKFGNLGTFIEDGKVRRLGMFCEFPICTRYRMCFGVIVVQASEDRLRIVCYGYRMCKLWDRAIFQTKFGQSELCSITTTIKPQSPRQIQNDG